MVTTLNKFGVPLNGAKTGMLQPKPQYRFRVRAINFGNVSDGAVVDFTRQVQNATRPTLTQAPVAVHSYNSVAYYAGKHEWNTVTVAVRDDISNNVTRLVGKQVQKQLNHFEQIGYAAGENYKFSMYIDILDGGNVAVLDEWMLEGCFLSNVNYGSLDYATSDPVMIEMEIRYDNALNLNGLFPTDAPARNEFSTFLDPVGSVGAPTPGIGL